MKKKPISIFRLTVQYNAVDETFKPIKRFTLHEKINYRSEVKSGEKFGNMLCYSEVTDKTPTREQRLENYEVCCIEKGIRPYHYSDSQWNQVLRDIADEEHVERCEAKHAYLYEF